jgi:hypothetical protein
MKLTDVVFPEGANLGDVLMQCVQNNPNLVMQAFAAEGKTVDLYLTLNLKGADAQEVQDFLRSKGYNVTMPRKK